MIGHAYVPAGGGAASYGVKVVTGMTDAQAPSEKATGMGGVTYENDANKTPINPSKDKPFIWIPTATFTNNFHTVFGENQNHSDNEINIPISVDNSKITLPLTDKKKNSIILNLNKVLTHYSTTTNNTVVNTYPYYLWTGTEWQPNNPPKDFKDITIFEITDINDDTTTMTELKLISGWDANNPTLPCAITTNLVASEDSTTTTNLKLMTLGNRNLLENKEQFHEGNYWFGPGMVYHVEGGSWTYTTYFTPSFSAAQYSSVTINYSMWNNGGNKYEVKIGLAKVPTEKRENSTMLNNDFLVSATTSTFSAQGDGVCKESTFVLSQDQISNLCETNTNFEIRVCITGTNAGCGARCNKITIRP